MRGEGRSCGVSANAYRCAHHVTWIPNKLWRSTVPPYLNYVQDPPTASSIADTSLCYGTVSTEPLKEIHSLCFRPAIILSPPGRLVTPVILKKSMGARHRVGIGLSYRPARLHRRAVRVIKKTNNKHLRTRCIVIKQK